MNHLKPTQLTRPRVMSFVTAQSNSGKTPFFDEVVLGCFVDRPELPAFIHRHKDFFEHAGPKGPLFTVGSDADFCERMDVSKGRLFWVSDEAVSCLDCDFVSGCARQKDAQKVDFHSILSTQNGFGFGPKSLKSKKDKQYHAPRTNFGCFLAGQARAIHEFFGATMTRASRVRGLGFEHRPLFLWAERQDDCKEDEPFVSFEPVLRCMQRLWVRASVVEDALSFIFATFSFSALKVKREPPAAELL